MNNHTTPPEEVSIHPLDHFAMIEMNAKRPKEVYKQVDRNGVPLNTSLWRLGNKQLALAIFNEAKNRGGLTLNQENAAIFPSLDFKLEKRFPISSHLTISLSQRLDESELEIVGRIHVLVIGKKGPFSFLHSGGFDLSATPLKAEMHDEEENESDHRDAWGVKSEVLTRKILIAAYKHVVRSSY